MNRDRGNLVDSGVHFGNNNVLVSLIVLGKLFPNRSQLLAVTAPGSIVLNKNVFGLVKDNRVVVFTNKNANSTGSTVGLGLLRHQVTSEFALKVLVSPVRDSLSGELERLKTVFLNVVSEFDKTDVGRGFDSKVLRNTGRARFLSVDNNEEGAAFESSSSFTEVRESSSVLGFVDAFDEEQNVDFDVTSKDLGGSLVRELNSERKEASANEGLDGGASERSFEGDVLILLREFAENNNRLLRGKREGSEKLGRGGSKSEFGIVNSVSNSGEGRLSISGAQETNSSERVGGNKLLEALNSGKSSNRGTSLFAHPVDDLGSGTTSSVVSSNSVLEEFEGGVSTNSKFRGRLRVNSSIEFSEFDGGTRLS